MFGKVETTITLTYNCQLRYSPFLILNIIFPFCLGLLVISSAFSTPLIAQPVIDASINPKADASFQFITFDTGMHNPGAAGPNQVWDFSKINCVDTNTLSYLDPSFTPYAEYFEGGNMAMTSDKESFQYFHFDEKGYRVLGNMGYRPDYETFVTTFYEKPEIMLKYPIRYQSEISHENSRVMNYEGYFEIYTSIATYYIADAFGKLILPNTTIANVLRLKIETVYKDSLTNGERYALFTQNETRYQWFAAEIAAPVLTIEKTERVDNEGNSKAYYDNTLALGLKENYLSNRDVFPLDFKIGRGGDDKIMVNFNLDYTAPVLLEISDIGGSMRKIMLNETRNTGAQMVEIKTADLPAGIYILTLNAGNRLESLKWVKPN